MQAAFGAPSYEWIARIAVVITGLVPKSSSVGTLEDTPLCLYLDLCILDTRLSWQEDYISTAIAPDLARQHFSKQGQHQSSTERYLIQVEIQ